MFCDTNLLVPVPLSARPPVTLPSQVVGSVADDHSAIIGAAIDEHAISLRVHGVADIRPASASGDDKVSNWAGHMDAVAGPTASGAVRNRRATLQRYVGTRRGKQEALTAIGNRMMQLENVTSLALNT